MNEIEPQSEPTSGAQKGQAPSRQSVVFRVLDLIQLVADAPQPMTLAEIGARLQLPKPTVHRLCARLERAKYLTREPGRSRYRVGPATERLGFNAIRRGSASLQWRAILERLVDDIRETCNFTAPAGDEVVYVERIESRWTSSMRLHLEPGSRVPIHCTASGKLFLATMASDRRRRLLEAISLPALTERTITSRSRLESELAVVSSRGYATDDEELLAGLVSVAVPVTDPRGRIIGAVSCHAAKTRLSLEEALKHLPRLRLAADEIGRTLI
jgi:DNA-binding IclR family transcriptional regulator